MREKLIEELKFCLELWERQGYCEFGGERKICEQCAVPYLLWKLLTGEVIHEKVGLREWKEKVKEIEVKSEKEK